MADATDEIDIDVKLTKLIIRQRLDMEEEFSLGRKKKAVLWGKVLEKLKEQAPNATCTKDQINRKFLNLLTTYRRIKSRNKESGRNATTWLYFEDFDEIYGTRHSVNPPKFHLVSTLEEIDNTDLNETQSELVEPQVSSPEPPPKKKKIKDEILGFLEEESIKEQKRHEENLAMEEKKLQFEEKRINTMIQLKEVLEKAICYK